MSKLKDHLHMSFSKATRQHILKMKSQLNSHFYFQGGGNFGTNDRIKKEWSDKQGSKTLRKIIMNIANS